MLRSKESRIVVKVLEAVYEEGVLKPLQDPELDEHQRVVIELRPSSSEKVASNRLQAWQEVYEGLSDEDVAEVEQIALDRSRFMSATDG